MDSKLIFEILIAVVGILGGSGGLFAFINARQQNKIQDRNSSAEEWQRLYNEMKDRLDEQEKANNDLRREITELKTQLQTLTNELDTYKKYSNYVNKLESYVTTLLSTIKPMISADAYNTLLAKKPQQASNPSNN